MLSARGPYGYPPPVPSRTSGYRSSLSGGGGGGGGGSGGFTASSPPRKVVQDFAAFGAAKASSVYGTAVQSTPFSLAGNPAAFGNMRTTAAQNIDDDDEEEEEGGGRQKVFLREDSITLDQVPWVSFFLFCSVSSYSPLLGTFQARRIAMQSAWRSRG